MNGYLTRSLLFPDEVKTMSWSGVPGQYRPTTWKILSVSTFFVAGVRVVFHTLLGSLFAALQLSVSLGHRRQLPVDACLMTVHTAGFTLRCSIALCFTQSRKGSLQ